MDHVEKTYKIFFNSAASIPRFVNFKDSSQRIGVSQFVKAFKNFDATNEQNNDIWPTSKSKKTADELVFLYLDLYFDNELFNEKAILQTTEHDTVMYALFSYLLLFDSDSLLRYVKHNNKVKNIIMDLLICRKNKLVKRVVIDSEEYPYVRCVFKILSNYFKSFHDRIPSVVHTFDVRNYLTQEFITDCYEFVECLKAETYTDKTLQFLNESNDTYETNRFFSARKFVDEPVIKYVTGQACTGKTTILNKLKNEYCMIKSRKSMGTFSGKSNSPETVASLHFAIDYNLRAANVLGDRGSIDNPLWRWIMNVCDPAVYNNVNLINDLFDFFSSSGNASAFKYLCQQKVAVFIDLLPSENKKRMLRRCKGGDAFRARINAYALVQAVAYCVSAKMFDWKLVTVPYNLETKTLIPENYNYIERDLSSFFGLKNKREEGSAAVTGYRVLQKNKGENEDDEERPTDNYKCNFKYAMETGIYK